MRLLVRPVAAADIEDIYLWYETQRDGLGDELRRLVLTIRATGIRNEVTPTSDYNCD